MTAAAIPMPARRRLIPTHRVYLTAGPILPITETDHANLRQALDLLQSGAAASAIPFLITEGGAMVSVRHIAAVLPGNTPEGQL